MYHHIAGVDFNRCEKKTNCANCSEAQQRQCEQELDQSYKSKTAKETIAFLPVIDDPVISDALREVGL